MADSRELTLKQRITLIMYRTLTWGRDKVAPGIRSLVGVAFMVGGVFGFLPVLGFWMLPLGAAFIAMDLPFTAHKIDAWIQRLETQLEAPGTED